MSMMNVQVSDLPSRKFSALKKKAQHLGLTPESYIRQLIEDDLALDDKARRTPVAQLAGAFSKAFQGMEETELDGLVEEARRQSHRSGNRKKVSRYGYSL